MTTSNLLHYVADPAIVVTHLATLAAAAFWMSATRDNTTNLYLDELAQFKLTLANGAPAVDKCCYIYVWGSDDNTNFPDGITGAEGVWTPSDTPPTNVTQLVRPIVMIQNAARMSNPASVAACFGGILPPYFGYGVYNNSGQALTAATVLLRPVYSTNG